MFELIGKYPSLVSENDDTKEGCPYKGCIKVLCPDILGFEADATEDLPFEKLKGKMKESDWVRPHYMHPSDFYTPEKGEGVYIEALRGRANNLIWTGIYPGEDFQNLYDNAQKDGINPNVAEKTDRIFGSRNGTYIKIEDKDNGKFIVEVQGKNKDNTSRKGCQVEIDPSASQIKFLAQDSDGSTKTTVTIVKDSFKVEDNNGNKVTTDSSGMVLEDKNSNKQEMTSSGIKITDKNNNKIEMTSSGIKITDKNNNTIEMASTNVKINGDNLKVTQ